MQNTVTASESGLPSPQHNSLTQQESAGENSLLAVIKATSGVPYSLSPLSHSVVPSRSPQSEYPLSSLAIQHLTMLILCLHIFNKLQNILFILYHT